MSGIQHLSRAPIKEALIDIRFTSDESFSALSGLPNELFSSYPKSHNMFVKHVGFQIARDEPLATTHDEQMVGYRLESEDGLTIAQLQLQGFTFSRLEPYQDWDTMVSEARRVWNQFSIYVNPTSISRIAVRYINALQLPKGLPFEDYITSTPVIPKGLPQELSGFLTRITLPRHELKAYCVVTQTLEPGDNDNITIVLDIDASISNTETVAKYNPDGEEVWNDLGELRNFKNDVFFNSITDRAKEMYV